MNGVQQAAGASPAAQTNGLKSMDVGYAYKGNSATTPATQAKTDAPASEKSGGSFADLMKMFSQLFSAFQLAVAAWSKGAEASSESASGKSAAEPVKSEAATEKKAEATASDTQQKSGDTSLLSSMFTGLCSSFDKVAKVAADKALKSA